MSKPLGGLAVKMRSLEKEITKKAIKQTNGFALEMIKYLAHNTPVDTSKALSNWILTLTKPSIRMISPHVEGSKGSTQAASAAITIAEAKQVLANRKIGHHIFITNNLKYIRKLNDNHPTKAGFIDRAFMKARQSFKLKLYIR